MTGERMTIGRFSQFEESQHTERYKYAKQFVEGKDVLDIACGTGYGCAMLRSAGAATVHGVDISSDAIEYASSCYSNVGIFFQVGNAEDLSIFPNESFDIVTSFETIEHLPNVGAYLAEIRRVLRRSGTFLVSTPDRRLVSTMYPLRGRPNNPFHLREYTHDEFIHILEVYFRVVECLGQNYISKALVFWPIQVSLKALCYVFRSFGTYGIIDRIYHNSNSTAVEPPQYHQGSVGTFWVARAMRE